MAAAIFIGFNIADAWLTKTVLALGAVELNPIAIYFGTSMVAKGLLATAIVLAIYLFRKEKMLWWANLIMLGVVLWNLQIYGILKVLQVQ